MRPFDVLVTGAGAVGGHAVEFLARRPEVRRLAVVDVRADVAAGVAWRARLCALQEGREVTVQGFRIRPLRCGCDTSLARAVAAARGVPHGDAAHRSRNGPRPDAGRIRSREGGWHGRLPVRPSPAGRDSAERVGEAVAATADDHGAVPGFHKSGAGEARTCADHGHRQCRRRGL